jgi:hypothetical protein
MKRLFLFCLLIVGGCTMYMPPNIRIRNVVTHYLDSINKPNKIELLKVIRIEPKDIDSYYENNKRQSTQLKTDSEKRIYGIDTLEEAQKYSFFCTYRINGIEHTADIQLDTTLSKVKHFTEMNR